MKRMAYILIDIKIELHTKWSEILMFLYIIIMSLLFYTCDFSHHYIACGATKETSISRYNARAFN